MTREPQKPNPATVAAENCAPGTDCDCGPPGLSNNLLSKNILSWPATLGIVAAGSLLCLTLVKLLGA